MICHKIISTYDKKLLKRETENFFNKLKLNIRNEKVLLKPNLISPKKYANTHPVVVESVAEFLKDCGNSLFIGDSPGVGTSKLNMKVSGYSGFLKRLDVKLYPFNKTVRIKRHENKVLKNFNISTPAVEFDNIINIAKLKTHVMTGMTLSVKNLFGFIAGKEKVYYHLKAGHDLKIFADILIDIYETVCPTLNIIDGITGMEGNGPTSGTSANFNIFAASANGYLLDRTIEKAVGFKGKTIISKQAEKRGLLQSDIENTISENIKIKHAKTMSASFYIPKFITSLFSVKPVINNKLCRKCNKCKNSCPTQAIFYESGNLKVDYSKCIKCYCCHELCIYNAVDLKRKIFYIT